MALPRLRLSQRLVVVAIVAMFCAMAIVYVEGKESTPKEMKSTSASASPAPSPSDIAPAPGPSSDGILIDQGIACVLMLLALVLTYLIHDSDLPKIEWMKE